jgi:hypothetical protein
MLSVIVTRGNPVKLAGLLAMLTEAAVAGVVRDVILVGGDDPALLDALCGATGAKVAADLREAAAGARSDWLLVVPPDLRLQDGWVDRLNDHLREGVREARLKGLSEGLFRRAPEGMLISRAKLAASVQAGAKPLAGKLGPRARRIG